jgi:eukaryotic-like serine/threonine-protein kinase
LELATVRDWLEDFEGAALVARDALESTLREPLAPPLQRAVALARGRLLVRVGQADEAAALLLPLTEAAAGAGDEETCLVAHALAAAALCLSQRLDEAQACFDQGLTRAVAFGDEVHRGALLVNRVLLWLGRNALPPALTDLAEAARLGRALGHAQVERWSSHNLGQYLVWLGRAAEAHPLVARAWRLGEERFGERVGATVGLLLARVEYELGRRTQAAALLRMLGGRRLTPVDALQLESLGLLLAGAPVSRWWPVLERAGAGGASADEQVDLLRLAVRAALRQGDAAVVARLRERLAQRTQEASRPLWDAAPPV